MKKYDFEAIDLRGDSFSVIEINSNRFLIEPTPVGILNTFKNANSKMWIEVDKKTLCKVFENMASSINIEKYKLYFYPNAINLETLRGMTIRAVSCNEVIITQTN